MHEAVDDVIQRRRLDPGGLGRAMSASVTVHVVSVVMLFVLPKAWLAQEKDEPLRMTISLGGSPGERSGGMVAAGSIPIEKVAPPPTRPEPIPPATPPKASAIAVTVKTPPKTPLPVDSTADATAVARPPITGTQVRTGTAVADTRATGQATGLTFGGEGAGDTQITLDATFCCPDYIGELQRRILVNWKKVQPEMGSVTVVFEIRKDGTFTEPTIEKDGGAMLNAASRSAFVGLRLPALPSQYKEDRLKIHLTFPYVR